MQTSINIGKRDVVIRRPGRPPQFACILAIEHASWITIEQSTILATQPNAVIYLDRLVHEEGEELQSQYGTWRARGAVSTILALQSVEDETRK